MTEKLREAAVNRNLKQIHNQTCLSFDPQWMKEIKEWNSHWEKKLQNDGCTCKIRICEGCECGAMRCDLTHKENPKCICPQENDDCPCLPECDYCQMLGWDI